MAAPLPDVCAVYRAYLAGVMTVPVTVGVPPTRPDRFVSLEDSGGERRNLVQVDPVILVQAWDLSLASARALAAAARGFLEATEQSVIGGVWFDDVSATLPVNVDDPVSRGRRFQFVVTPTVTHARW